MSKISVIIPVFNVEKYLEECLDSVCNQTFKNLEIICINDGSTDNSLNILETYLKNDDRIKIISQNNQGLGAARNAGLKIATGDLIYFIDSDDYIDLDTLQRLYDNMMSNDSDMVLFKFNTFGDDKNIHSRGVEFKIDEIFGDVDYKNFTFNYKDVKKHVLNTAFSACLKLYKKDFLDSFNDFYFPERLAFEDIVFHVKAILRARKISFLNESLYYYRSNPTSILNFTANGFDIFEIIDIVEEFLKDNGYYDELENEFIFFKIAQILVYMNSTKSEDYFIKTKEEFEKLEIKDENTLKRYALDGYLRVLNSNSYIDYIHMYYSEKIDKLNKRNMQLKKENKKLKQINNDLLTSASWKITKPIRGLKKLKK